MKVLVDTPIWFYAFGSKKIEFFDKVTTLKNLILDQRVIMLGIIKQELLSGYSDKNKFAKLLDKLTPFGNTQLLDDDFIHYQKHTPIILL
jgi:hypothetical protein